MPVRRRIPASPPCSAISSWAPASGRPTTASSRTPKYKQHTQQKKQQAVGPAAFGLRGTERGSGIRIQLEHRRERLAGQGHAAQFAHLLFAFLLLFQQLLLAGDVAAV